MISAERAIKTYQRDLTISSVLRGGLFFGMFAAAMLGVGTLPVMILLAISVAWAVVSMKAARRSYLMGDSPALIASGQFAEAEEQIEKDIRSFWQFKSVKLRGLHHLAVLRHAQRQWRESAILSQALLRQRLVGMPAVARTTRLMLADSLLELGDLPGAHHALLSMYAQKLTLTEAMNLLVVQLDYEGRIGAWSSMLQNIGHKIQMAELMPSTSSARSQAMLSLAASKLGNIDLAVWLRRRAELLADINELTTHRPILKEVWQMTHRLAWMPVRLRLLDIEFETLATWRLHVCEIVDQCWFGCGHGADDCVAVGMAGSSGAGADAGSLGFTGVMGCSNGVDCGRRAGPDGAAGFCRR